MSKVTNKGFYDGYVASAYWSTNELSEPTHYRGYVILQELDIEELKHFGSVLITCFSVDGLGDVYPSYRQDFTPISFDLSKDKPIGKHPYGNTLSLVFEDDTPPNTEKPLSENSPLLNIESDKQKQELELELEERRKEHDKRIKQFFPEKESQLNEWTEDVFFSVGFSSVGCQIQDTDIHWAHWLNLKEWTKEQAASLICGFEPNRNISNTTIVEITQKIGGDLKLDQAPPIVWLKWFNKVGLLDESGKLASWLNEQLAEKELTGDLSQDDANWNHQAVNLESNETKTIIAPPVQQNVEPKTTCELSTRQKQIRAILEVIESLNFERLSIPHGGKSKIEVACRNRYDFLNTPDKFKRAWQECVNQNLVRTEKHEVYARNHTRKH